MSINHFWLKQAYLLLFFTFISFYLYAQLPKDSIATPTVDSLLKDSVVQDSLAKDTIKNAVVATPPPSAAEKYFQLIKRAIEKSSFLNAAALPSTSSTKEIVRDDADKLFYFILGLVIFLAILKFFFGRYFSNLFRVFFNTSLRQSQLTDQLLQAKQASMLFNLLFTLSAGVYIYLLLKHYNWAANKEVFMLIFSCAAGISAIYVVKFISLKITGWLTGYSDPADTYLFIIFLVNKILGVVLIPFVIVMAFSPNFLKHPVVILSLLIIGSMFLLRFIRSYGLLHNQIKVSRFHFFLYIAGIELLPVLLIYKAALILLDKNL